jgi:hypothetical protein
VSGAGTIVNLEASTYCFDATHCRDGKVSDYADAPVLTIGRGEDILVSVPKAVATGQWLVSAFRVDETGTQKAVDGLGTPTLHDVHHAHQTDAAGDQASSRDHRVQRQCPECDRQLGRPSRQN